MSGSLTGSHLHNLDLEMVFLGDKDGCHLG